MNKEADINRIKERERMEKYFARHIDSSKTNLNNEEILYNKNQKTEIKSIKFSSLNTNISFVQKNKLESAQEQRQAKAALDNMRRQGSIDDNDSKSINADNVMNGVANQAVDIAKDKLKQKIKTQIIAWTAGCLGNPITWLVILAFCFVAMLVGMFSGFGSGDGYSNQETSEMCSQITTEEASEMNINCNK